VEASPWGLLVLDKPSGPTSHATVQRVCRALEAKKGGHAGTLDPLASGVLLVALGRATRLLEYLVGHDKTYRARLRLGECRDTLDREGRVLETRAVPDLDRAAVEGALRQFQGRIDQVPPVYSAIKHRGVPLHRRARQGEAVTVPSRRVEIRQIELVAFELPELVVELTCSKGTYVRALARDLGAALETGATLWELVRTRSGPFGLEQAVALSEVERAGIAAWSAVHAPRCMVQDLPTVVVDEADARTLASGRELHWMGLGTQDPLAVFDRSGELVAVARSDGDRLRPEKVFRQPP
jgi:tRNA pseudouridine55 synthase